MMASFLSLLPFALLAAGALTPVSDVEVLTRAEGNGDDIDAWLAAALRVSPDALQPCPLPCSGVGESAGWFLFPDVTKLALCNETMLLDMTVPAATEDDKAAPTIVRACSADFDSGVKAVFTPDDQKASLCTTANRVLEAASVFMHQPQSGKNDDFSVNHLLSAGRQIVNHLALQKPSCENNAMEFAYSQSAAIGLYSGVEIHQHGITLDILTELLDYAQKNAISKTTVVQICGADSRGADYSFGIIATGSKNLPLVQDAIKTWASGECVSETGAGEDWMTVTLRVPVSVGSSQKNSTDTTTGSNSTTTVHNKARSHLHPHLGSRSHLSIRADCRTATVIANDGCYNVAARCGITETNLKLYNRANLCTTLIKDEKVCCSSGTLPSTLPAGNSDGTCKTRAVVSGDTCGTLASKCGVSSADFMKANTKTNLCATLAEGQKVCCSAGTRPDFRPKPTNGNCAVWKTQTGNNCGTLAAARDLTVADLETFNKNTWGWMGCKSLYPDFNMCTSAGNPPMPAIVANAVCGPTMNGTVRPATGTALADVNPCPLNVCCNVWGQCGMTDDFCTISKSETGAPGTSAPGKNGCVSNCGKGIIVSTPPATRMRVAYFESWNLGRKCLHMSVDEIDTSFYTHIHFAFANVTTDFRPEITDPLVKEQFDIFKAMTGVKRIISFGGWAFSVDGPTHNILRNAVLPANRDKFKNNLIAFMNEHGLDGIDLDWEYPGAPDLPGIPADDPANGMNYYRLLSSLKSAVGSSKSISFAAPASYWYLKSFPIKLMAQDLDYIIYMTYDLHGQWDYGNTWTSPGCPNGNCLRSHVNSTETDDALSMITKAGAPTNKIVVGVTSYGRSFKMAQTGCDVGSCLFTGSANVSMAAPGRCTETGGYISNAEINEIISTGRVNKQFVLAGSNILVYNDTEWVAYMDDEQKAIRASYYDGKNFLGTTDWAVDLQEFVDGSVVDDTPGYIDLDYRAACGGMYTTFEQLEASKGSIADHCVEQYLLDVQVAVFNTALTKYKDLIDDGYDNKFKTYAKYVRDSVPDQLNAFMASENMHKYFRCKITKIALVCCGDPDCKSAWVCGAGTSDVLHCSKDTATCSKGSYEVLDCPSGSDGDTLGSWPTTFELHDPKGFYAAIAEEYGIEESWIKLSEKDVGRKVSNGCAFANTCEDEKVLWSNYPMADYDKIEVFNPKKLIGDSYPNAVAMRDDFELQQQVGQFDEETRDFDLVDATSIPVFSAQEGIASMEKIVEQANEIEEAQRKEFILMFLGGLLAFIPFAGSALGAAGITAARAIGRLIGTTGELALTVYDIVDNPENAFLAIFGFLAGGGRSRQDYRGAAASKRAIKKEDLDSLGPIKVILDRVLAIRGNSCKR